MTNHADDEAVTKSLTGFDEMLLKTPNKDETRNNCVVIETAEQNVLCLVKDALDSFETAILKAFIQA